MGKFLLVIGFLTTSSAANAFEGTCIYSENKVATGCIRRQFEELELWMF